MKTLAVNNRFPTNRLVSNNPLIVTIKRKETRLKGMKKERQYIEIIPLSLVSILLTVTIRAWLETGKQRAVTIFIVFVLTPARSWPIFKVFSWELILLPLFAVDETFKTISNHARIRLHSDGSQERRGFVLAWRSVNNIKQEPPTKRELKSSSVKSHFQAIFVSL